LFASYPSTITTRPERLQAPQHSEKNAVPRPIKWEWPVQIMTKCALRIVLPLAMTVPAAWAAPPDLSPSSVFEGTTTAIAKDQTTPEVNLSVQTWAITAAPGSETREIPLHDFYIAHLISGQIAATVDGQTTKHRVGDYWTVKPGTTMQVKALGEIAILETTVVTKK